MIIARIAAVLVVAFLLGGIPVGLILVRIFADKDIRTIGSGKTGATNVQRELGWAGFGAAVIFDALKGIGAVLIAREATHNAWVEATAGVLAILGHTFSPYLGFRGGGRGMVTAMGAAFFMAPILIALVPVFLIPVLISRYMSLGNIVSALVAPFVMLVAASRFGISWAYFAYVTVGSVLILINHKDNIERILAGTERKIGDKTTLRTSITSSK